MLLKTNIIYKRTDVSIQRKNVSGCENIDVTCKSRRAYTGKDQTNKLVIVTLNKKYHCNRVVSFFSKIQFLAPSPENP